MTDSEKLDLLLERVSGIDERVSSLDAKVSGISERVSSLDAKVSGINERVSSLDIKVNRLEVGQTETKKELYMIDRRISDTYKPALDAWGQSAENRV